MRLLLPALAMVRNTRGAEKGRSQFLRSIAHTCVQSRQNDLLLIMARIAILAGVGRRGIPSGRKRFRNERASLRRWRNSDAFHPNCELGGQAVRSSTRATLRLGETCRKHQRKHRRNNHRQKPEIAAAQAYAGITFRALRTWRSRLALWARWRRSGRFFRC